MVWMDYRVIEITTQGAPGRP